ncbi:hypothetical protein BC332_28194 [Capsicum chinense]|nr:hypothetical protein BC332_28194 [Capsicum chinense]
MTFSQPIHNNHMMMGHSGYTQHHGRHYGHVHGHYGNQRQYGSHEDMPHDSTNISSNTTMIHNNGGYGCRMQLYSHAHMSSMAMGHHGHSHGHGHASSHPSNYCQSQKFNWVLKNMD